MKVLIAALFILATGARAADTNMPPMGSLAYLDWKNGFRDVKFGMDLSLMTNMVKGATVGEMTMYTRKGDDLTLGPIRFRSINYDFQSGKLVGVTIVADRKEQPALLAAFKLAYGRPMEGKDKWEWTGEKVVAYIDISGLDEYVNVDLLSIAETTKQDEDYDRQQVDRGAKASKGL